MSVNTHLHAEIVYTCSKVYLTEVMKGKMSLERRILGIIGFRFTFSAKLVAVWKYVLCIHLRNYLPL